VYSYRKPPRAGSFTNQPYEEADLQYGAKSDSGESIIKINDVHHVRLSSTLYSASRDIKSFSSRNTRYSFNGVKDRKAPAVLFSSI
jgi:hypothetical protein